jgi:hypothetical protein
MWSGVSGRAAKAYCHGHEAAAADGFLPLCTRVSAPYPAFPALLTPVFVGSIALEMPDKAFRGRCTVEEGGWACWRSALIVVKRDASIA